eukprot:TRINITY_DN33008_c0_g1_i1.p1 TRINITY_DN33008_c0_g1~~TRINITY_DN33008_c0_g1_i1.p1  ORF type:complete len:349 (-),score=97.88 TRINITY_DN33008_c0_g1_i1:77-1099(-)
MFLLFVSEVSIFLTPDTDVKLFVDHDGRNSRLRINLDIIFHHVPCAVISLDAMDISGEQQNDILHSVHKRRLNRDGQPIGVEDEKHEIGKPVGPDNTTIAKIEHPDYCGSCYGAEEKAGDCCNTCDEVRAAYRRKSWAFTGNVEQCAKEGHLEKLQEQNGEGCEMYGYFEVQKVAGNFHFAPGRSFQHSQWHVHDYKPGSKTYNISHTIARLSFGREFPNMKNPLDAVQKVNNEVGMYQYFVKIVPTTYSGSSGVIDTNQYSVTEHFRRAGHGSRTLPGVFFIYDLSPIMVKFTETRKSFLHFLTELCAIIGGVFTVAGIIDSLIYNTHKHFKNQIGKGG